MKYIKNLILIGVCFLCACSTKVNDKTEKNGVNQNPKQVLNQRVDEIPIYDKITDSDTALAYFLYYTHDKFMPKERQIEYERLDFEYENQIKLIRSIFSNKGDISEVIKNIDKNRNDFVSYVREKVISDLTKYHGISGRSFNYLLKRNDSLVKPILLQVVNDSLAPKEEKEYALKLLIK